MRVAGMVWDGYKYLSLCSSLVYSRNCRIEPNSFPYLSLICSCDVALYICVHRLVFISRLEIKVSCIGCNTGTKPR